MTDRPDTPPELYGELSELPLRDRIPEYLAVFGIGLVASVALGLLIGLSSMPTGDAVGYVVIGLGVVLMLAGGATGGGYTNMGMGYIGSMFSARTRPDDDVEDADVRRGGRAKVDPHERLRRGLRPEANPRAFWQVMGGVAYVMVGFGVLQVFGS